jgi:hypothetical protein
MRKVDQNERKKRGKAPVTARAAPSRADSGCLATKGNAAARCRATDSARSSSSWRPWLTASFAACLSQRDAVLPPRPCSAQLILLQLKPSTPRAYAPKTPYAPGAHQPSNLGASHSLLLRPRRLALPPPSPPATMPTIADLTDRSQWSCASVVKERWCLRDADLQALPKVVTTNRWGGKMYLFHENVVKAASYRSVNPHL